MRKKNYRITPIRIGEDTPCKECDYFLDNRMCTGNCQLIRRWKYVEEIDKRFGRPFTRIKGYIYKHK